MAVSMGGDFLVTVDEDGNIFTCGQNEFGQLAMCARMENVYVQCANLQLVILPHKEDRANTLMVSAGTRHAACVTLGGSVYTWGNGEKGQLGTGDEQNLRQPMPQRIYTAFMGRSPAIMVACGHEHTLLLTKSGEVWGAGSNEHFQIGLFSPESDPNDNSNVTSFTRIPPARFSGGDDSTQIAFIAASNTHSVAVGRHNGVLWTWGEGLSGKLGHGDGGQEYNAPVPTAIPSETFGEAVVFASARMCSTMAITESGVLWVSGYSHSGAIGLDTVSRCVTFQRVGGADFFGTGGVRNVACSRFHSLIVAHNGSVWVCGGVNSIGLGIDTNDQPYMVPVELSPVLFDNEAVVVVSACESRSVAVTTSGRLYTWGAERPYECAGLGYSHGVGRDQNGLIQWTPKIVTKVMIAFAQIKRMGCWHNTLTDVDLLTFAMGTHPRLGDSTEYQHIARDLLQSIAACRGRVWQYISLQNIGLRLLLGL